MTLDPKAGLARTFGFEDPTTFTMELVQNASFHDGTPFDADAVKFNLTAPAPTRAPTSKPISRPCARSRSAANIA